MLYAYPALVIFGHVCAARINEGVAADALTRMGMAHTTAEVCRELSLLSADSRALLVVLSDQWALQHGWIEVHQ
jgi:hypothetical protein